MRNLDIETIIQIWNRRFNTQMVLATVMILMRNLGEYVTLSIDLHVKSIVICHQILFLIL